MYEWIHQRGIKLIGLKISEKLCDWFGSLLIPVSTEYLQKVSIRYKLTVDLGQGMNDILASCDKLYFLRLENVAGAESLYSSTLSRLQTLTVVVDTINTPVFLNNLSTYCTNLISLTLEFICRDHEVEIAKILQVNRNLTCLTLKCRQSILFEVAQYCINLVDIVLKVPNPLELVSIRNLLGLRPTIKRLFMASFSNSVSFNIEESGKTLKVLQDYQPFDEDTLGMLLQQVGEVDCFHYSGPGLYLQTQQCVVDWAQSYGHYITQLTLVKIKADQIETLLSLCPNLSQFTVNSNDDLVLLLFQYSESFIHLSYTGYDIRVTELRIVLPACSKLKYGRFDIAVTGSEVKGGQWISELSEAAKHIEVLELYCRFVDLRTCNPRLAFRLGVHSIGW